MKSQNYMIVIPHNAYNMVQKNSHLIFKVPGKQIKLQEIVFPLQNTETPG